MWNEEEDTVSWNPKICIRAAEGGGFLEIFVKAAQIKKRQAPLRSTSSVNITFLWVFDIFCS